MMLWTLVVFILILGVLIVHFLSKGIKTIAENYFIYPSAAEFDQAMPAEILEQVMTLLDPLALIECRHVSKYWRYHATRPHVEQEVMDAYDRVMKSSPLPPMDFGSDWSRNEEWFDEPNYSKTLKLRDRALATKHGKQLLEISIKCLRQFLNGFEKDKTLAAKYIIKTTAMKGSKDFCRVTLGDDWQTLQFDEKSVPGLEWEAIPHYHHVDIMFDLADYVDLTKRVATRVQTVYSVRERHPVKYFGFVPLDADFLQVLVFIFAPLIVHDVLNAAFLSVVKTWFGPILFLVTCVVNFVIINDFKPNRTFAGVYGVYSSVLLGALVLLTALAYPYSMTYHSIVGLLGLTFVYVVLIYEYTFSRYRKTTARRAMPAIIAVVLVLLMNDWKVTVDSIKNGVIWFRLFDNTVSYAILCLNFIALNALSHRSRDRDWEWRFLLDWDKEATIMLLKSYALVVFVTLYAPTWLGNHL